MPGYRQVVDDVLLASIWRPAVISRLYREAPVRSHTMISGFASSPGDNHRLAASERNLHAGGRVFGMARAHGSYAEYTAVPPGVKTEPLARIPDGVSCEQAAALPIPGLLLRPSK